MADYTSRAKLKKPAYIDQASGTSAVDLTSNFTIIDTEVGFTPVTAATRDSIPDYQGQLVIETDTENIYIGVDGAWVLIGNRKFAKGGLAAPVIVTTSSANISNTEALAGLAATVNVLANRKYLVDIHFSVQNVSDSGDGFWDCRANYRWASGASITTSSTLAATHKTPVTKSQTEISSYYKGFEWFPNITGQATVGLCLIGTTASRTGKMFADANHPAMISVKDYGGV